jgi:hypothetical protein
MVLLEGVCASIFKRLLEEFPDKSLFEKAREVFGRSIKGVDVVWIEYDLNEVVATRQVLRGTCTQECPKKPPRFSACGVSQAKFNISGI